MHAVSSDKAVEEKTRRVLNEIFAGCPLERVGVRLWNGAMWPDARPREAILLLNHPGALSQMLWPGTEVGLAEAYLHDDFDVEGDIEAAFEIGDFLLAHLGEQLGYGRHADDDHGAQQVIDDRVVAADRFVPFADDFLHRTIDVDSF